MASLRCPHCDAPMPDQRTWAEAALSTLVAAPAVSDMATQRRCDNCGRVSAASDLRHTVADRFSATRFLLFAR
jgi:ribosomal protein S26